MATRIATALTISLLLAPTTLAQTVRFDTNVGNIDLILNPDNNGNLQTHVENVLRYVEAGRYDQVVLNRADNGQDPNDPADDFVLQFGGFLTGSPTFTSFSEFLSVPTFDPVIVDADGDNVVDFGTGELTNTRSTVALALGSLPTGATDVNSGTSSFFVSSGDSSFLDASGFVPFARVADMSTVDYIMRLNQISDPSAGLASQNIPIVNDDNFLVIVEQAICLNCDTFTPSAATAISALAGPDGAATSGVVPPSSPSLQVASIPEPPALVLILGAIMLLAVLKPTRLKY